MGRRRMLGRNRNTVNSIQPIHYFDLNELSGNPMDSKGGVTGVNYGAIQGVAGVDNTAYQFTSSNYCDLGTSISINNDSTVMMWIKIPSLYKKMNPFQYGGFNDWGSWNFFDDGKMTFYYGLQGGGWDSMQSNFQINNNTWIHCAMVRDHTNGIYRYSKNGVTVVQKSVANTAAVSPIGTMLLGKGYVGNMDGFIDELKIFNVALTDEQIQAEML